MMAISKFKAQVPDCVMSDLNMEQMDGLEFCKELRTIGILNKAAIIMVSAENAEVWEQRCLAAGADAFIQKPINPQTLAQKITDIINNKAENGSSNGTAAPIIVAF